MRTHKIYMGGDNLRGGKAVILVVEIVSVMPVFSEYMSYKCEQFLL